MLLTSHFQGRGEHLTFHTGLALWEGGVFITGKKMYIAGCKGQFNNYYNEKDI